MEYIMETRGLTKAYKGKTVVDHVDMHVKKGEIYGFVGPNGAGKSTLLKMLMNLTRPDSGEIRIFGKPVASDDFELLKRMGAIIEDARFYDRLTGRENLALHGEYMGYHNTGRIDEMLGLAGLTGAEGKAVRHYSLGMKQRLAIARALLTRPEFLILDEPINALDPDGIREMRGLFRTLNEKWGVTILVSSHILSEVEQIADTVGVIRGGRLLREVAMETIRENRRACLEAAVSDAGRAGGLLEEGLGIRDYQILSGQRIRIFDPGATGTAVSSLLVENGVRVESLYRRENSLEDYFFELTEEVE